MRTSALTTAGILAFSTTAQASTQWIRNYCLESVFLTSTNGTGYTTGPLELSSGEAFTNAIVNVGNSLGVTKTSDYWDASTAKLIFGTSADSNNKNLYWTVSSVDGDPMKNEVFNVTSAGVKPDVCGHANGYDGQVHACADDNVALTLNLC